MIPLSISRPARKWNGEDFTIAQAATASRQIIWAEPRVHGADVALRVRAESDVQEGDVIAIPINLIPGA